MATERQIRRTGGTRVLSSRAEIGTREVPEPGERDQARDGRRSRPPSRPGTRPSSRSVGRSGRPSSRRSARPAQWALDRAVAASLRIEKCERAFDGLVEAEPRAGQAGLGPGPRGRGGDDRRPARQGPGPRLPTAPDDPGGGRAAHRDVAPARRGPRAPRGMVGVGGVEGARPARRPGRPPLGPDADRRPRGVRPRRLPDGAGPRGDRPARRAPRRGDGRARRDRTASGRWRATTPCFSKPAKLVLRYERDAWRRYRESIKEVQAPAAPIEAPTPAPPVEAIPSSGGRTPAGPVVRRGAAGLARGGGGLPAVGEHPADRPDGFHRRGRLARRARAELRCHGSGPPIVPNGRESSSEGAGTLPPPPSSNRTGGFPASGLPELLCHNTCTVSQRLVSFGLSGWKPNRRRWSETDSPSGIR